MPKSFIHSLNCFLLVLLLSCNKESLVDEVKLVNLRTEHLTHPMGIDQKKPRLSWKIQTETPFYADSIFIKVAKNKEDLLQNLNLVWNTKTQQNQNLITYSGSDLEPFTTYFWQIQIKDKKGNLCQPEISSFETGMLSRDNWRGYWITDHHDMHFKPAPYFRQIFQPAGEITSARAYIASAGYHELLINGKKIGDHLLDPGYTRFDKRILYVTHDVSEAFKEGKNNIGVILGNGWYNHQSTAVWNFHKAEWRERPSFIINIRVTYQDGSTEVISSNPSWQTTTGAITFNSIYTAEHYDATKEGDGFWNVSDSNIQWENAKVVSAPTQSITAQQMPPIRAVEKLEFKSIRKITNQHYILDLGRNIAGRIVLNIAGEKGTEVRLTHGEQLDSSGLVDLSNIIVHYRPQDDSDPFQTDIVILSGKGKDHFTPKFNYKGFQYVEVKSTKPIELTKENIYAEFMHTDVTPIGQIESSNDLLNAMWEAANASYLSNLHGYPTDCPQREKNGWTGDAHINIETGLYNYDAITVYEKWLQDHKDEQRENGVLPSIIPTWGGWGYDWGNGPDWTSSVAIIPWQIYMFYGDRRLLEQMYDPIKKYVNYIASISYDGGLTDWGLGDWVPVKSVSPKELTSSIYFFVVTDILAKSATLFDKDEDANHYRQLAENIKSAINKKYLNTETGIYGTGLQTEMSAPLYWGITPEESRQKVADQLAKSVVENDTFIDVGLLGTRTILGALSKNGHAQLAFALATQDAYPSWGWWIKNGATTFLENWDINATRDISRNHIMFGAVNGWLYSDLGGIQPKEEIPGFKSFLLKPNLVNGLDQFKVSFQSPYGEISSGWQFENEKWIYRCNVPPNSTATLDLSSNRIINASTEVKKNGEGIFELESGAYWFEVERN